MPSGKTASTTAGEVGKALIGRNMVADPKVAGEGMGTNGNTSYVGRAGLSGKGVIVGVTPADSDAFRELLVTHEGMHGDGAPSTATSTLKGTSTQDDWNTAHQGPFNTAAESLLAPLPQETTPSQ